MASGLPRALQRISNVDPLTINPLSLINRNYSGDPNIKASKRRGFINHGSIFIPSTHCGNCYYNRGGNLP